MGAYNASLVKNDVLLTHIHALPRRGLDDQVNIVFHVRAIDPSFLIACLLLVGLRSHLYNHLF